MMEYYDAHTNTLLKLKKSHDKNKGREAQGEEHARHSLRLLAVSLADCIAAEIPRLPMEGG